MAVGRRFAAAIAVAEKEERDQDAQRQFEQAMAQRDADREQPAAHRLDEPLRRRDQGGAVGGQVSPVVGSFGPMTGILTSQSGGGGGPSSIQRRVAARQIMDVVSQCRSHDDKREEHDAEHPQCHQQRGEGAPSADQLEQPPIQRPGREGQQYRPKQRRRERKQHEHAAAKHEREDDPAEVLLKFRCERRQESTNVVKVIVGL